MIRDKISLPPRYSRNVPTRKTLLSFDNTLVSLLIQRDNSCKLQKTSLGCVKLAFPQVSSVHITSNDTRYDSDKFDRVSKFFFSMHFQVCMLSNVSSIHCFCAANRVYMYVQRRTRQQPSGERFVDSYNNFPAASIPPARAYAFYGLHPRDLKLRKKRGQGDEKKTNTYIHAY